MSKWVVCCYLLLAASFGAQAAWEGAIISGVASTNDGFVVVIVDRPTQTCGNQALVLPAANTRQSFPQAAMQTAIIDTQRVCGAPLYFDVVGCSGVGAIAGGRVCTSVTKVRPFGSYPRCVYTIVSREIVFNLVPVPV